MNTRQYLPVIAALLSSHFTTRAQDLLPLKQLELGQTEQQMFSSYPQTKIIFAKRNGGSLVDGLVAVPVTNSPYWSGAIVRIINDQVASIGYAQAHSFDLGFSNAPIILRQLIRAEGTNYTRAVSNQLSKTGNVDSPVLIWEKADRMLAYTFMPLETYKPGEPFVCQLTVFPKGKKLGDYLEVVTRPNVDQKKVFKSVDETITRPESP